MSLSSELKKRGYDLIEGPIRKHQVLQLWNKRPAECVEFYYESIHDAFNSTVDLPITVSPALDVNATVTNDFNFNIGITVLDQLLQSLGLGNLEISAKIKTGKKITISYDNSISQEVGVGKLEEFLSAADFNHSNAPLLNNLNADNVLIITGVVLAKNLISQIDVDYDISADVVAQINSIADGKLQLTKTGTSSLKMVSGQDVPFPIAVKANKLRYHNSVFNRTILVTDDRNFF